LPTMYKALGSIPSMEKQNPKQKTTLWGRSSGCHWVPGKQLWHRKISDLPCISSPVTQSRFEHRHLAPNAALLNITLNCFWQPVGVGCLMCGESCYNTTIHGNHLPRKYYHPKSVYIVPHRMHACSVKAMVWFIRIFLGAIARWGHIA
jgi:hypothetical protein